VSQSEEIRCTQEFPIANRMQTPAPYSGMLVHHSPRTQSTEPNDPKMRIRGMSVSFALLLTWYASKPIYLPCSSRIHSGTLYENST
jgi:hypothetical protein